jgi:hypothetical protein
MPLRHPIHAALDLPPGGGRTELHMLLVQQVLTHDREIHSATGSPGEPGIQFGVCGHLLLDDLADSSEPGIEL